MEAWIPVVSSSLYFWKSVFSFQADGILKSDGDFESFLTACISLVHEPDKPRSRQQPSCTNSPKELRRNCSPIGHHNTKHFLCSIRNRHPLEFLEIVRWESVPRGSFTRKKKHKKHSSRPFSRPDWLPLGLRGWTTSSSTYHTDKRLEEHINVWNPLGRHVAVWCSLALILQGIRVSHLHKFAHRPKSISKLHLLYKYWKLH